MRMFRQYDVKSYLSSIKYVILSTNFVTAGFELGGGLPSAWRVWAGGGEGGAHAVLYWPVLEVEWQATPCHAPPCSPSLCGVVWSTPMRRRFLWPASEHMATGWEDEGGWCAGSVLCNTKFLRCPDHSPSQHTATLHDKDVMLTCEPPHTLICRSWPRERLMCGWQTWSELSMMLIKKKKKKNGTFQDIPAAISKPNRLCVALKSGYVSAYYLKQTWEISKQPNHPTVFASNLSAKAKYVTFRRWTFSHQHCLCWL